MRRTSVLYEIMSLSTSASGIVFLFWGTGYLTEKDYVAAGLSVVVSVCLLRVGLEFGKLALVARRRRRERGDG